MREIIILPFSKKELIELINTTVAIAIKKDDSEVWLKVNDLLKLYPKIFKKGSIFKLCNAGVIPSHKFGRNWLFLKSEIDFFIKNTKPETIINDLDKNSGENSVINAKKYLLNRIKKLN